MDLFQLFPKLKKQQTAWQTSQERVRHFFTNGWSHVRTAEKLFECQKISKKNGEYTAYEFGLPLMHGIELLLKSFLLLRDASFNSPKKLHLHNIKKLYEFCLSRDVEKTFGDGELKTLIAELTSKFYRNSVDARYPSETDFTVFRFDTFNILNDKLIQPLNKFTINFDEYADPTYESLTA